MALTLFYPNHCISSIVLLLLLLVSNTNGQICCTCTEYSNQPNCTTDTECQSIVCGEDSWCCEQQWNDSCAELATNICNNNTLTITNSATINPTFEPTLEPTFEPTLEPTISLLNIQPILCNTEINGNYTNEPLLFELSLSDTYLVSIDACYSLLQPIISIYPFDDNNNILNKCDLDFECCSDDNNVTELATSLPTGRYYIQFSFDEETVNETINIFGENLEYIIDVFCDAVIVQTSEFISTYETYDEEHHKIELWMWLLIAVAMLLCPICLVLLLVRRKGENEYEHPRETSGLYNDTEDELEDVDDEQEVINAELEKFMDESVVINDENYDDIY
eukprot:495631_1